MNDDVIALIGGEQKHQSVKTDGVCTTLCSSMGTGGGYIPMIVKMAGDIMNDTDSEKIKIKQATNLGVCKVESRYRIRKLTPRECWRLMAFSDEDFDKAEKVVSNTQLYKQAGNSICVCVLMAIFSQMNIKGVKTWNERN